MENGKKLIENLIELFKPFVDKAIRPQMIEELKDFSLLNESRKVALEYLEKNTREIHELANQKKEIEDAFNALVETFKNPQPFLSEIVENDLCVTIVEETKQLITAWLEVLNLNTRYMMYCTLKSNSLDEAMLPPMKEEITRAFEECFTNTRLDPQTAREILRQVRASLPQGQRLPDAARELLLLNGITVI